MKEVTNLNRTEYKWFCTSNPCFSLKNWWEDLLVMIYFLTITRFSEIFMAISKWELMHFAVLCHGVLCRRKHRIILYQAPTLQQMFIDHNGAAIRNILILMEVDIPLQPNEWGRSCLLKLTVLIGDAAVELVKASVMLSFLCVRCTYWKCCTIWVIDGFLSLSSFKVTCYFCGLVVSEEVIESVVGMEDSSMDGGRVNQMWGTFVRQSSPHTTYTGLMCDHREWTEGPQYHPECSFSTLSHGDIAFLQGSVKRMLESFPLTVR